MPALLGLLAAGAAVAAMAVDELPISIGLAVVAGLLIALAAWTYQRLIEQARWSAYVRHSLERPDDRKDQQ